MKIAEKVSDRRKVMEMIVILLLSSDRLLCGGGGEYLVSIRNRQPRIE